MYPASSPPPQPPFYVWAIAWPTIQHQKLHPRASRTVNRNYSGRIAGTTTHTIQNEYKAPQPRAPLAAQNTNEYLPTRFEHGQSFTARITHISHSTPPTHRAKTPPQQFGEPQQNPIHDDSSSSPFLTLGLHVHRAGHHLHETQNKFYTPTNSLPFSARPHHPPHQSRPLRHDHRTIQPTDKSAGIGPPHAARCFVAGATRL